jgi:5,10-methylene-tetrahydrofolate dehydrogenase/methenyl tetrahydrofolate cyclohydrolase
MASAKAIVIDGKAVAATIQDELKDEVETLQREYGLVPGLAVILVGDRVDSATYVRMKKKMATAIGIHSVDVNLPATVSQEELLHHIEACNTDPKIHGILVQLPLPSHIEEAQVLAAIAVHKDVDGFSATNIGNLCLRNGDPPLAVPCTPAGCIELLQRYDIPIGGKDCVVLGRSNIVGMPVAALLQSCNGTVTVCHSRTLDIPSKLQRADIVIAAIGKPEFVRGEWLKPGAVVIDVGINTKVDPTKPKGYRLVGDVHFEECRHVASAITPVPGGVGPMTIVMLMKNTINLARHSKQLPRMPLRNTIHRNLSHRDFVTTTTTPTTTTTT